MADSLEIDYTGLKLGEKKDLKNLWEARWAAAQTKIQQKFGADWKLIIEWPQFSKFVTEDNYRKWFGQYLIEMYAEKIAAEIEKMDADLAEAINDRCKNKKLVLTISETKSDAYPAGRYGVDFGDNLTICLAPDRFGTDYPYSQSCTITAFGEKHF